MPYHSILSAHRLFSHGAQNGFVEEERCEVLKLDTVDVVYGEGIHEIWVRYGDMEDMGTLLCKAQHRDMRTTDSDPTNYYGWPGTHESR